MFNANVTGFDVGIWILLKHVSYFIKHLKYFHKISQFFRLRVASSGGGIWNLYFLFLVNDTIKGTLGLGLKWCPNENFNKKSVSVLFLLPRQKFWNNAGCNLWSTFFSHPNSQNNGGATLHIALKSINTKVTVSTYVPTYVSFSRPKLTDQSPPNFVQTSLSTQGRFLTQAWPRQLWPLDPGVPQTLIPKRVMGEKTLCNIKCPGGWHKLIKFFPGSAGPGLLVFN